MNQAALVFLKYTIHNDFKLMSSVELWLTMAQKESNSLVVCFGRSGDIWYSNAETGHLYVRWQDKKQEKCYFMKILLTEKVHYLNITLQQCY